MATIGVASASYYANASIQQFDRASVNSVERISKAKNEIANGDAATLAAMDYTFKLDLAGTQAALKNIAVTQAYLSTAITSIDSASAILAKIQELAVMGANSTNSDVEVAGINAEAEALADEFHKAIINANYKGKQIFTDDQIGANLSIGGGGQIGNYTIAALDYDDFYDVKNPNVTSLMSGVEYEITRELSDAEKASIIARTDGLTEDDLVEGFKFTTNPPQENNIGAGTINNLDDPGDGNLATYANGMAPVTIDSGASVNSIGDFNGGYFEFEITENFETSDIISIANTANIQVDNDGYVSYLSAAANNQWIEIGKIDEAKNGSGGAPLRINLFADATIPGTSNILNGDFSATDQEIVRFDQHMVTVNQTEDRLGVVETFSDANGVAIATNANNPNYKNLTLAYKAGQAGNGDGTLRANIQTNILNGVEEISAITILDGGSGYAEGEVLTFQGANGTIEFSIAGVANKTVNLTRADVTTTTQNVFWGPGESGFYDFDANGAPAVGADRLQYSANEVKLTSSGPFTRLVPNPNGVELNPETGERTNDVQETYYTLSNVTEVTGSVYNGEINLTKSVWDGTYDPVTETAPQNWTRFEGRVNFGENFTISEYANGANDVIDQATGTVNTAARVEFDVPTPTDAIMAETENGPGNDDMGLTSNSNFDVTVAGGRLALNQSTFDFSGGYGIMHGPAAVSDQFLAQEGDFLKFSYTATSGGDHYHVAGYIYEVDANGNAISDPILALNETGASGGGRASVEVPKDGTYRFVFINGTYDESGLRRAGASMTIDNIVAEDPYAIEQDALTALNQAIQYTKAAGTTNSNATKTFSAKLQNQDESNILYNNTLLNIQGYAATDESGGPYMIAPTFDLVATPSDSMAGQSDVLTSRIEAVQQQLKTARIQAVASYGALDAALSSVTDLRSQYAAGSSTISDLNFTQEAANLTKRQIQMDIATSMLAQANKAQEGIMSLLEK